MVTSILVFNNFIFFGYVFSRDKVKVIVYGQGVETFHADMSSLTQSPPPPSMQVCIRFPITINKRNVYVRKYTIYIAMYIYIRIKYSGEWRTSTAAAGRNGLINTTVWLAVYNIAVFSAVYNIVIFFSAAYTYLAIP